MHEKSQYVDKFKFKQDKIQRILNRFKKKTRVLSCTIENADGYILASATEDLMKKIVQEKIIGIYSMMGLLAKNGLELNNFNGEVNTVSVSNGNILNLPLFSVVIKTIVKGISLIVIIPEWLNHEVIFLETNKILKKLSTLFKVRKNLIYNGRDIIHYSRIEDLS